MAFNLYRGFAAEKKKTSQWKTGYEFPFIFKG